MGTRPIDARFVLFGNEKESPFERKSRDFWKQKSRDDLRGSVTTINEAKFRTFVFSHICLGEVSPIRDRSEFRGWENTHRISSSTKIIAGCPYRPRARHGRDEIDESGSDTNSSPSELRDPHSSRNFFIAIPWNAASSFRVAQQSRRTASVLERKVSVVPVYRVTAAVVFERFFRIGFEARRLARPVRSS